MKRKANWNSTRQSKVVHRRPNRPNDARLALLHSLLHQWSEVADELARTSNVRLQLVLTRRLRSIEHQYRRLSSVE